MVVTEIYRISRNMVREYAKKDWCIQWKNDQWNLQITWAIKEWSDIANLFHIFTDVVFDFLKSLLVSSQNILFISNGYT